MCVCLSLIFCVCNPLSSSFLFFIFYHLSSPFLFSLFLYPPPTFPSLPCSMIVCGGVCTKGKKYSRQEGEKADEQMKGKNCRWQPRTINKHSVEAARPSRQTFFSLIVWYFFKQWNYKTFLSFHSMKWPRQRYRTSVTYQLLNKLECLSLPGLSGVV